MKKLAVIILCFGLFALSGCALFKKNRVSQHNGIERTEFNLPIFIYKSKIANSKKLLIFLSGDGGWIKFEDDLSLQFADKGFNTIGINSRSYFWKQKTPEEAENDVAQLIRKYALEYKTNEIYLCGYSFGADVLPFIYKRLPFRAKRHVQALGLLSPFATTDFMVHFSDLTNTSSDNYPHKVNEEVKKLLVVPIYCFYGNDENEKALQTINQKNFHLISLSGDHHYEESEYEKIVSVFAAKK
ncbi:AcvB/VirJ family lysyl-phosphatidylglycerol hydrolase [Pedobacter aquatilis]|uniref:AcvB/VirJ family lysyl-phosphatidylglycerol hydrolase n=1 Tax=Pedobacter aquatilis TaxID=351343 RepID=UPI00292FB9C9|nr:AcvB/VirJ family lysyl-phosphatidylglycerol hydrolase [Pedobacter aquatilis]